MSEIRLKGIKTIQSIPMKTNTISNQSYNIQESDIRYPHSFLHYDTISATFIEELASLESMQDNVNYIGEVW